MKKLLSLTTLLFLGLTSFAQITSATPVIKLFPQNITSDINGGTIEKGDTIKVALTWKNNSSSIRTIYLDFQHQISAINLLDIQFPTGGSQGSALPTGTQTSYNNNYYPGYFWQDNQSNNTDDGLNNASYSSYGYNQTSQKAINRITLNFSTPNGNVTNLGEGDLAYLRFKVEQVGAGYAYDSIYMNFAYGWGTNGGSQTIQMPRVNASSWVDVAATSNALINGDLKINSNLNGTYQPKIQIRDSATSSLISTFALNNIGEFVAAQQVSPNTPYKLSATIPADSLASVLNKAVTVSDYTSALAEWNKQNLDGTFTNQTMASGISFFAADVNKDRKFDGADLGLIFAQAVGYDTILVAPQGTTTYNLPTFLGTTYDSLTYNGWKSWTTSYDPSFVNFKTSNVAQGLSLRYIIPGDINRSHSSLRTQANNITTYGANPTNYITSHSLSTNAVSGYINSENSNLPSIDVNLSNLTVTSNNIEIPINVINKGQLISAIQFEFVYEPTKVKFEELKSNFPNSWTIFVNSKDGRIKFVAIDREMKTPLTGNIPFSLRFTSIGEGVDISSKIQVTQNMDASDNKGTQLGINLNTTTIKLTGYNKFR